MEHPYDHGDIEGVTVVLVIVLIAALLLEHFGGPELWGAVQGLHP